MGVKSEDIYGADPQPDVQKVTDMAMKCMKGVGKVTEAESTSDGASSSRDITGNLGQAKP